MKKKKKFVSLPEMIVNHELEKKELEAMPFRPVGFGFGTTIKILTKNAEPFLRKGQHCEVKEFWENSQPIVIGNDGYRLRLERREDYEFLSFSEEHFNNMAIKVSLAIDKKNK